MAKRKKEEPQVVTLVNSSGEKHKFPISQALAMLRFERKKYNRLKNWSPLPQGEWEFTANELVQRIKKLADNKSAKES